jgi:catalase
MSNKDGSNSLKGALDKIESLEPFRSAIGESLTPNQGMRIADNQNSLKTGMREPTLLEDFILREKITHFDPERVAHARGEAAHGYFQVYESMAQYTKAKFLQDPDIKTPVFVRFSTVVGLRGSADTARDVRGFAVKFYTEEGNYDLVGNNIPVFFIQDAAKFTDLLHAIKPEPHNEVPQASSAQASSAHDTFWDFISQNPESMHMIMWLMSDRATPRSHRMMEGFGVNTFRFITADDAASFVRFHWKPLLGIHSLAWEEAQQLAGKDADFHRRDLWEAIEAGDFPEWELGVQIIDAADEFKFDFDILDATKLIPEALVPVKPIGKLTLNRNPDNLFAETEQVAFHPVHVVPGIDFSNDSLLQGRLFSYLDMQLIRLGGPNFPELPINRPVCPVHNNQRDGYSRQTILRGRVAYEPNTLAEGYPKGASAEFGGFMSYAENINDPKIRMRGESFEDHYSQAALFWNSQSDPEKKHIVSAFQFELGKVEQPLIRERLVTMLNRVDEQLAAQVAEGLGIKTIPLMAPGIVKKMDTLSASPALSMANTVKNEIRARKVAILAAESVDVEAILNMKSALENAGAKTKVIASSLGILSDGNNKTIAVDHTIVTQPSVAFDAVFIAGSKHSVAILMASDEALQFVAEAYKHGKAIATMAEGEEFLRKIGINTDKASIPSGVIIGSETGLLSSFAQDFITAIASHRHWHRPALAKLTGATNTIRAALQRDD